MSDPRDERVVREDGIRLRYRMDAERFPIPAPTFRLRSEREDPARVRLALPLPDGFTSDDIGLHPDYAPDGWSVKDALVFERSIDGGDECETLFGVKGIDEEAEFPLDAVSIEVLDAVETGVEADRSTELGYIDDLVDRDRHTAVREFLGGERETLAGPREGPAAGDAEAAVESGEVDGRGQRTDSDSVARALLRELQSGAVSEADRERLREELEPSKRSTDARIDHLQTEVGELAAYTDALETFIDENGSGQEIVDDLDDLRGDVRTLREEVDALRGGVDALREEVDALAEGTGTFRDELGALHGDVASVEAELSEFRERVEALETLFDQLGDLFRTNDLRRD